MGRKLIARWMERWARAGLTVATRGDTLGGELKEVNGNSNVVNALTFDVEDYFHVSAFERNVSRKQWDTFPSRVEDNTRRLLDILAEFETKATFFVLGWVAERCGSLVKEIARQGHEIASHGYSHRLIYTQTRECFTEETAASKALLENLTGNRVLGYRAASFSITEKSLWALEILKNLGFSYDTSIFPVRHDRYGIPGAYRFPHRVRFADQSTLTEFPISTAAVGRLLLPVSGGGYFRLFPYWWTRFFLSRINRAERMPFVFYLHPWEVDPQQPRFANAPLLSRIRHYTNLGACERRLRRLLTEFHFSAARDVLAKIPEMPVESVDLELHEKAAAPR